VAVMVAFFDPLTQMPNRRLLKDRLSQAIATSKRISQCVRAVDTVSRFVGDEFVILLNDLGLEQDLAIQAATR
jgi:GGDEF domain-containing protein